MSPENPICNTKCDSSWGFGRPTHKVINVAKQYK